MWMRTFAISSLGEDSSVKEDNRFAVWKLKDFCQSSSSLVQKKNFNFHHRDIIPYLFFFYTYFSVADIQKKILCVS